MHLSSLLAVHAEPLPALEPSFYCVAAETVGRTHYWVVRSARDRDAWLLAISQAIERRRNWAKGRGRGGDDWLAVDALLLEGDEEGGGLHADGWGGWPAQVASALQAAAGAISEVVSAPFSAGNGGGHGPAPPSRTCSAPRAGAEPSAAADGVSTVGAGGSGGLGAEFALTIRPWAKGNGRLVLNQSRLYWPHADVLARTDAPPAFGRAGGAHDERAHAARGARAGGVLGGGGGGHLPAALQLPPHLSAYGSLPELSARLLAAVLSLTAASPRAELAAVHSALSLLRLCTAVDAWPGAPVGAPPLTGGGGGEQPILSQEACLACWLNLYHTLVAHSLLTFGPPLGARHFSALHRTSCYALADGTFSPSDLEHCVLRGGLSKPRVGWLLQMLLQASHSPLAPSLAALGGSGELGAQPLVNFVLNSGEPCAAAPLSPPRTPRSDAAASSATRASASEEHTTRVPYAPRALAALRRALPSQARAAAWTPCRSSARRSSPISSPTTRPSARAISCRCARPPLPSSFSC